MRRSTVIRCISIGSGLAAVAATLAAGGSEAGWLSACAGFSAVLICEIAGWLWVQAFPPRRRAARHAVPPRGVQPAQPTRKAAPVPVYAARVADLAPDDFVRIVCNCGRAEMLTADTLAAAGVAPEQKVTDLGRRMRCRACVERGGAIVSVKRGKLAPPLPV